MPTVHEMLITRIAKYSGNLNMRYDDKSKDLEHFVRGLNTVQLSSLLEEAGFIPEEYGHDSSEEKVYAKAMDVLVAVVLRRVGYETAVSVERSNSADVEATSMQGTSHRVVLDAKAFRFPRTAKNPKDYKIEALSTWKKGADYACLASSLAGFPYGDSRLFEEALSSTLYNFSLYSVPGTRSGTRGFQHLSHITLKGGCL